MSRTLAAAFVAVFAVAFAPVAPAAHANVFGDINRLIQQLTAAHGDDVAAINSLVRTFAGAPHSLAPFAALQPAGTAPKGRHR
jgi:hypothetical protein